MPLVNTRAEMRNVCVRLIRRISANRPNSHVHLRHLTSKADRNYLVYPKIFGSLVILVAELVVLSACFWTPEGTVYHSKVEKEIPHILRKFIASSDHATTRYRFTSNSHRLYRKKDIKPRRRTQKVCLQVSTNFYELFVAQTKFLPCLNSIVYSPGPTVAC